MRGRFGGAADSRYREKLLARQRYLEEQQQQQKITEKPGSQHGSTTRLKLQKDDTSLCILHQLLTLLKRVSFSISIPGVHSPATGCPLYRAPAVLDPFLAAAPPPAPQDCSQAPLPFLPFCMLPKCDHSNQYY